MSKLILNLLGAKRRNPERSPIYGVLIRCLQIAPRGRQRPYRRSRKRPRIVSKQFLNFLVVKRAVSGLALSHSYWKTTTPSRISPFFRAWRFEGFRRDHFRRRPQTVGRFPQTGNRQQARHQSRRRSEMRPNRCVLQRSKQSNVGGDDLSRSSSSRHAPRIADV